MPRTSPARTLAIRGLLLTLATTPACDGNAAPDAAIPDDGLFSADLAPPPDAATLLDRGIPDAKPPDLDVLRDFAVIPDFAPYKDLALPLEDLAGLPDSWPSSTDAAWTPANGTLRGGDVRDIKAAPSSPGTLYACTHGEWPVYASGSVYKTIDGGKHWNPVNNGLGQAFCNSLVVDPTDSQAVYVATADGVFKTTDGGAHWRSSLPMSMGSLAMNHQRPAELYVTADVLYKTTDAGAHWTAIMDPCGPGEQVNLPVVAPGQPSRVCLAAGINHSKLCCSNDSGMTWTVVSSMRNPMSSIAFDPTNSNTLLTNLPTGIGRSTDGGRTWSPSGGPSLMLRIAFSPPAPSKVIAVGPDGVWLSANGGASFTAVTVPLHGGAATWDPVDSQTVYAAGGSQERSDLFDASEPIWKSADGGKTWSPSADGFSAISVFSIAVAPQTPDTLWMSYGWLAEAARSDDGGGTWSPTGAGLQGHVTTGFAVDPDDSSRVYAGTAKGLMLTTDDGKTWTTANPSPVDAIAARRGQVLALLYPPDFMNVYSEKAIQSIDNGKTWTTDPEVGNWGGWGYTMHLAGWMPQIILDPRDPASAFYVPWGVHHRDGINFLPPNIAPPGWLDVVMALDSIADAYYIGDRHGEVVRSDDHGQTWTTIRPMDNCPIYAILADPRRADTVWIGTCHGVWKTSNGGRSWRPTFADPATGFMWSPVLRLAIDPTDSSILYAGSAGGGLFKTVSGGD